MTVRTQIIQIGDSPGILIPSPLLEQSGLSGEVELEVDKKTINIRAAGRPREGWEEAFAAMDGLGEDVLLDSREAKPGWDEEAWEWT